MKTFKQNPLFTGTIILTLTGMITRLIGFYYRIYLTRLFGEEGMGIYQLTNPVLSISFALTSAGFQTTISKVISEYRSDSHKTDSKALWYSMGISTFLSVICTYVVYTYADYIGSVWFGETRTVELIKVLAFSIPLSSIHSCINGYFYGDRKAALPAFTQLAEQIARVLSVYIINTVTINHSGEVTPVCAAMGLTIGELISFLISVVTYYLDRRKKAKLPQLTTQPYSVIMPKILAMVIPLTANRIIINILQSIESVSIPSMLKQYGLTTSQALSIYGVVTGMVLPLIFFPNSVTGSMAVLLLPAISESSAQGNIDVTKKSVIQSIKYSLLLGFICLCIFVPFGPFIGNLLFDSAIAGSFIRILGFICPFLYLNTTLSGILQGFGVAFRVFLINCGCMLLRLFFIYRFIPVCGISGYLWGLLAGQLLQCMLYFICLIKETKTGMH